MSLDRMTPALAGSHKRLSMPIVDALHAALTADLAAVDNLVAETEALQRQARTPQSR